MKMIETRRLFLRKLGQEDIDLIFDINNPPECTYLYSWITMPLESCKDIIDNWIEHYKDTDGIGVFCVEDKENKYKIGMAYILDYKVSSQFIIGFRLRNACWDGGYANEITQGLIKHAESNLDANTLIAKVRQSDSRLRNVFEELKFEVTVDSDDEDDLLYRYIIDNERLCK